MVHAIHSRSTADNSHASARYEDPLEVMKYITKKKHRQEKCSDEWSLHSDFPAKRAKITKWIYDVCEVIDQNKLGYRVSVPDTGSHAVQLFDMYIKKTGICKTLLRNKQARLSPRKNMLQTVACACISIAYKAIERIVVGNKLLARLSRHCNVTEVREMEESVFRVFDYDLYFEPDHHIVRLLHLCLGLNGEDVTDELCKKLNVHCLEFADKSPLLKAACVMRIHLRHRNTPEELVEKLTEFTKVNKDELDKLVASCVDKFPYL